MERTHELDPQRVCTLVLARLLPESKRGPERAEVVKSVAALLPGVTAAAAVERAWKQATDKGWIGPSSRLTEAGKRTLCESLGVDRLPKAKNWLSVQRTLLGRLSLGTGASGTGKDFAADVVCAAHGLPAGSLRAAVDRLAWRALGVETDAKFDALAVQRHLLREIVPTQGKLEPRKFRQMIAARALQAEGASNDQLRRAALRRWVAGIAPSVPAAKRNVAAQGVVVTENDNAARGETSLERFALAVLDAARRPGVTRFHDDRAFIGSLWANMRGREPVGEMSLDAFKERLVEAHRKKLIRMSRADLVQVMDPAEVARSEARYLSATFHFVAVEAGGAK